MTGTVLITGVNGLLGRALALRLQEAGRAVVGMDVSLASLERWPFPVMQADINDVHRLYAALDAHPVDAIVHCGGVSGRMVASDNPSLIVETNVRGTTHVLEAARLRKLRRVVFCSSNSAYGRNVPDPLTEDAPLRATTVYGASKAAAEAILHAYAGEWGVDAIALRIFHVYGPRRTTECYIRLMIQNAQAGQPTRIAQGATSRRQYVHVEDVVDALILALDAKGLPRRAYNVSGGSSHSLAEVAEIVGGVVPGVSVTFGDDPVGREYAIGGVDESIAARELGYRPRVSLEAGIASYAEWLKPPAR